MRILGFSKKWGKLNKQWFERDYHTFTTFRHKNGVKADNRIENLQLTSQDKHNAFTVMQAKIDRLKKRIKELEEEKRQWRTNTKNGQG